MIAAILAAEQRRCAAMLAGDNAALDAVLHQDLHFSHATGAVDDKIAYMAKMAADPETQRWWKITEPMQRPLPGRPAGTWWTPMKEVFHQD